METIASHSSDFAWEISGSNYESSVQYSYISLQLPIRNSCEPFLQFQSTLALVEHKRSEWNPCKNCCISLLNHTKATNIILTCSWFGSKLSPGWLENIHIPFNSPWLNFKFIAKSKARESLRGSGFITKKFCTANDEMLLLFLVICMSVASTMCRALSKRLRLHSSYLKEQIA